MAKELDALEEEKVPKRSKVLCTILVILFLISLGTSGYLIYNLFLLTGIEDIIRYIVIGILILVDFISLIKLRGVLKNKVSKKKKKKKSKRIGFILFLIFYSGICFGISFIISYLYGTVDNINKKYVTYSSSLIVLKEDEASKASDMKNYKIGVLKDHKSPEGYIIPQEIIKEDKLNDSNDIEEYDSYIEMITDLYSKDLGAIFVATDYANIYSSIAGYENIGEETKIIQSKEKKMLKSKTSEEETKSSGKNVTEPFTILLMGIDSTDEVLTKNAVANGDSLILITFNPKTLNATMLSIPRDSYVPISCWPGKDENKITHAAAYGNDCMINTIEDFFDVDIDYYAKINFKGLVNLVNALGGIDVEVPQDLCTDDSSRGQQVCIKEGFQHLDGEGALVLSRNRKQLVNGDFGRGQNQQLVIQAMLTKIKDLKSVKQFTSVMNTVANSIDTNLTTKQILSFYSIAKDILKTLSTDKSNIINIQQLYLQGQSAMIYDKRMRMTLYNYVPNTYSRDDITEAMKANLELIKHKDSKSFTFSINEPYEKKIIGEGPYKSTYVASKYPKAPDTDKEQNDKKNTTTTTKPNINSYDEENQDDDDDNGDDDDSKNNSTVTKPDNKPTVDPEEPKNPDKGEEKPTPGTGGNQEGSNPDSSGTTTPAS